MIDEGFPQSRKVGGSEYCEVERSAVSTDINSGSACNTLQIWGFVEFRKESLVFHASCHALRGEHRTKLANLRYKNAR